MSSTDDDSTDRLEALQATPRTTVQDAGNIEGGSLSATRLLRSLGKFVGLGSAAPRLTQVLRTHQDRTEILL